MKTLHDDDCSMKLGIGEEGNRVVVGTSDDSDGGFVGFVSLNVGIVNRFV
jgi:hypothetical protein